MATAGKIVRANDLTFQELRRVNPARSLDAFGFELHDWSPSDWAMATLGEMGELANYLKKSELRGESIDRKAIEDEFADVQIYLDLWAARMGVDLGAVTRRKFNEVSDRRGSSIKL